MSEKEKLFCYGCCHSASGVELPGQPSGERPCCFCIRNKTLPDKVEDYAVNCWYNGSKAVSLPMDCYHSIDMMKQFDLWAAEKEKKKEESSK